VKLEIEAGRNERKSTRWPSCGFVFGILIVCVGASTASAQRERLFDRDWKFHLGDLSGAEAGGFDDSGWRGVQLPHDWSIEGPFDEKWASCSAYLPSGIGWYRKTFSLPAELKGKMISVRFEGIYDNSTVWINGHLLGTRPNGFVTIEYDLTPFLQFGDSGNTLAVRVDRSANADARWYVGAGINRHVILLERDPVHIQDDAVYVTTPTASAASAVVHFECGVKNESAGDEKVGLDAILRDAAGAEVGHAHLDGGVGVGKTEILKDDITVENGHLWSVDDPYLYTLEFKTMAGSGAADDYSCSVGLRTFRFDPNLGFSLNGKSMKLKGVCVHEDAGALGVAVPPAVWERRLAVLRDVGCNAIRTSHNPPSPEFLDVCDRMGFLVMDEMFDEWTGGKRHWTNGHNNGQFSSEGYSKDFDQWCETDLAAAVRRDRNHPSIILWSIGNEIDFPKDPFPPNSAELPPIAARLIKVVHGLDSRPVTAACAAIATNLFFDQLDVVGYNYQEGRYAKDHADYPNRVMFGSENVQTLVAWNAVVDNPFISGQFLWVGIDYMGEARGWPVRSSASGLIDLAGFPRPAYYFRKTLWSEKPVVELMPYSRFVTSYSNCDRIEMFWNGQSIGEKANLQTKRVVWQIAFDSGTLKAVGKMVRNGSATEVCSCEITHADSATGLKIVPDTTTLETTDDRLGLKNVAQIEVDCVDSAGNRDLTADNEITVTTTGPVKILGIESGDPTSHENYQAPRRMAYRGRILVYLQSTNGTGPADFSVSADGLKGDEVGLSVR
jgi:beta-galactosidase